MIEEEQKERWKSGDKTLESARSDMMETEANVSQSQNTDFGLLESMLEKGKNQDSDKAMAFKATVA